MRSRISAPPRSRPIALFQEPDDMIPQTPATPITTAASPVQAIQDGHIEDTDTQAQTQVLTEVITQEIEMKPAEKVESVPQASEPTPAAAAPLPRNSLRIHPTTPPQVQPPSSSSSSSPPQPIISQLPHLHSLRKRLNMIEDDVRIRDPEAIKMLNEIHREIVKLWFSKEPTHPDDEVVLADLYRDVTLLTTALSLAKSAPIQTRTEHHLHALRMARQQQIKMRQQRIQQAAKTKTTEKEKEKEKVSRKRIATTTTTLIQPKRQRINLTPRLKDFRLSQGGPLVRSSGAPATQQTTGSSRALALVAATKNIVSTPQTTPRGSPTSTSASSATSTRSRVMETPGSRSVKPPSTSTSSSQRMMVRDPTLVVRSKRGTSRSPPASQSTSTSTSPTAKKLIFGTSPPATTQDVFAFDME